jgi:hypothetical protein
MRASSVDSETELVRPGRASSSQDSEGMRLWRLLPSHSSQRGTDEHNLDSDDPEG